MPSGYKRLPTQKKIDVILDFLNNPRANLKIAKDNEVSEHFVTTWTSVYCDLQYKPTIIQN